jgi:hypothetical protein
MIFFHENEKQYVFVIIENQEQTKRIADFQIIDYCIFKNMSMSVRIIEKENRMIPIKSFNYVQIMQTLRTYTMVIKETIMNNEYLKNA